jgi:type IV secretion system protein VirB8
MQREDRFVNPLGFQVQRYRRDAETLTPPDPAPAPMSAPGQSPQGGTAANSGAQAIAPAPTLPSAPPPRRQQELEVTL